MVKVKSSIILLLGSILLCSGFPSVYKDENAEFSGGLTDNKTITDETLRKVFEKFKEYIGPDEGFKSQHIFTNTSKLFLNATFNDVHVTDPSAYTIPVSHVNMTTLNFNVEINYATLKARGNYEVEAENDLFHLVGKGPFQVNITNMSVAISWKFNLTAEKTLQMEYFDLNYIIQDIKVNIEHLGGDEEVSQTLNDLINIALPSTINVTKGDVEKFVNQIIQHSSLFIFTGMTLDKFIEYVYDFINF